MSKAYPRGIKQEARRLITDGQTKSVVSQNLGIPYDTILEWTKDIKTNKIYPKETREEVRKRIKDGQPKTVVSQSLGISYHTIRSWTRDMKRIRTYPKETKEEVRKRIKNGQSKTAVSKQMNIQLGTIIDWTRDLKRSKIYPQETKEKVRERVKNGETKRFVAETTGICYDCVRGWTRDIAVNRDNDNRGVLIRGKTLTIVKDLMEKGYSLENVPLYTKITLKKYFPVKTARIKRNIIFYLEERNEEAFRAFLDSFEVKAFTQHQINSMALAFGIKDASKAKDIVKKS